MQPLCRFLKKYNKTKWRISTQSSNPTPIHKKWNPSIERNMHSHGNWSTSHNNQEMRKNKFLSTYEWIKRMWYGHTMEYYSATNKDEILRATSRKELEVIMISEVVKQRNTNKTWSHSYGDLIAVKNTTVVARCWGEREGTGRGWLMGIRI